MAAPSSDETEPRYIPPGSCTWCGHPPHDTTCDRSIRTGKGRSDPCPCTRHRWISERTTP